MVKSDRVVAETKAEINFQHCGVKKLLLRYVKLDVLGLIGFHSYEFDEK
mgnify:CR=1 FL=1